MLLSRTAPTSTPGCTRHCAAPALAGAPRPSTRTAAAPAASLCPRPIRRRPVCYGYRRHALDASSGDHDDVARTQPYVLLQFAPARDLAVIEGNDPLPAVLT